MFDVQYKRIHIPTGKEWINSFNDTSLVPYWGSLSPDDKKYWVGDCQRLVDKWNKMGVVDGKQMWKYELIIKL
jgi:hypothetical protein